MGEHASSKQGSYQQCPPRIMTKVRSGKIQIDHDTAILTDRLETFRRPVDRRDQAVRRAARRKAMLLMKMSSMSVAEMTHHMQIAWITNNSR